MQKQIINSSILDANGNPIKREVLTSDIDDAQLSGVRNMWSYDSIASGLTPSKLAQVLNDANQGRIHDFLTLAEEMEERDPHYGCELGKRKLAVSGIEPNVEAASDDPRDVEIAEDVQRLVESPRFSDLIDGALDGLGKGFSCVQQDWETSERQWMPSNYEWRDPRFFTLDQDNGKTLMLLTDAEPIWGEALQPYRWIVHEPRIKMGLPIRGSLARLASIAYMCKSFALGDWMTFAEVFGMPIRIGKYHSSATPDEKATLRRAVQNIGTDASAIMPDSMKVELLERSKASGGDSLYETLCKFLDGQISKGILGQTMTAENGSSNSQAQVHNDVRLDICRADARQLEATLNAQVIEVYVRLNYGIQKRYPTMSLPIAEAEDINALTNALKVFVPLGLNVAKSQVLDKLGLRKPMDDEEVLQVGTITETVPPLVDEKDTALNRQQPTNANDDIDNITDELDDNWQQVTSPIINPLQKLLNEVTSADEFKRRLPELLKTSGANKLVNDLADRAFRSRSLGNGI